MESTMEQTPSATTAINMNNQNNNDMTQILTTESAESMSSSAYGDMSLKESKTNLIVNYLPQNLTVEEFKEIFESIGEIESCKLVRDKSSGQSLCYGFVNYVNMADADKAVKSLNKQKVQNKIIKVSYARPSCESIKGANLYACGIPKSWLVNDLNNYFSKCGVIITSRILYNENGQSKGVAFIRYDQREEAELAVRTLNGILPYEHAEEPISVKFANYPAALTNKIMASLPLTATNFPIAGYYAPTKPTQIIHQNSIRPNVVSPQQTTQPTLTASAPPYTPLTNRYNSYANNYIPAHEIITNIPTPVQNIACPNPAPVTVQSNQMSQIPPGTGWCIFVYSLSPDADDNILWQLFGPFGAVQNVKVVRDYQTQKCKGFGFVTMTNYEEAVMAINCLNGITLGDRVLQVSFKTNNKQFF